MPAYEKLETGLGVEIAYTDSGAPSQSQYITIIAIHGTFFCAPVFKRAQAVAAQKGVRFVAINRRNYPGSTPFAPEDIHVLKQGSEEQKAEFLKNRAHEIAMFIDKFIQKNELSPISEDGGQGGVIILGWSVGCGEANATIAHSDTLPPDVRSRLSSHIRALVLYEAGPRILGLPMPPKDWSPFHSNSIPPSLRVQSFAQWVTAYFDHGDLSSGDLDALSYVLFSTSRPGSMFNMSKSEQEEIIKDGQESSMEGSYFYNFDNARLAVYRKAIFGNGTAQLFPEMKVSHLAGDKAPSFAIAGHWAMQKEVEDRGKFEVIFKLVPGMNHFVHWDEPERAIDLFLECAGVVTKPGLVGQRCV